MDKLYQKQRQPFLSYHCIATTSTNLANPTISPDYSINQLNIKFKQIKLDGENSVENNQQVPSQTTTQTYSYCIIC